jgi:glycosyltransferase involved in cell wall biosynthesis
MKVLHLPVNISSQISCTVRALRSIGVEAHGLVRRSSVIQDSGELECVDWIGGLRPIARLIRGIRWRSKLLRRVNWADVIHWHWGDTTWRGLDLRYIAWRKKPRLIEFWGDDLRQSQIASRDNSFLNAMYAKDPTRAVDRGAEAQTLFRKHGFDCLIPGYELADYLRPDLFTGYYQTRPRLMLEDYIPKFPEASNRKPLLVHAPSETTVKGTDAVLAAVAEVSRDQSFDFRLIHNLPRAQALEVVASCDVFLDQFVLGCEGLAALEAMALGKPVVCFIKPSLMPRYPSGLPIIVADQNTLSDAIRDLVQDGARRRDAGIRSRDYVEEHHDARKVAAELKEIYADVLSATKIAGDSQSVLRNRHWHTVEERARLAEGVT